MNNALLILNAGSSSLKFAVHTVADATASAASQALYRGSIEGIGPDARLQVIQAPAEDVPGGHDIAAETHEQALHQLLAWLEARQPGLDLHAAGHRVVHGGSEFSQPVRIDERDSVRDSNT
jgi:acetate kinase